MSIANGNVRPVAMPNTMRNGLIVLMMKISKTFMEHLPVLLRHLNGPQLLENGPSHLSGVVEQGGVRIVGGLPLP
jgi:hypothetical protein